METIINTRLLPAYKTEAVWGVLSTIPKNGEILYTSDGNNAGRYKIGDGVHTWSELSYVPPLICYGTCGTAAATTAKVATVSNFPGFVTGAHIQVKFTYSNTASSPTLNVNSSGAKSIYRYGTTVPSTAASTSWNAGAVLNFTYDGSAWVMNDWLNVNSTYTNASLGQGVATQTNTSQEIGITASNSSYALTTGGMIMLTMKYDMLANSTLSINSKDAKPVWYKGAAVTAGVAKANDRVLLMYSGSYYHILAIDRGASVVPPTISSTATTNGYNLTITDANGTNTISITNGSNGSQGPAGYTPVRGTDYWTTSDQNAIVSAAVTQVLNQLPAAESNSF